MTIHQNLDTVLTYYAQPGVMSDPGPYAAQLRELPADLPALVHALQGLVLHIFWAERYGVALSDARKEEVQIHSVQRKLATLLALDPRPLTQARPFERRLVCNCRDFSLLLASILKAQGIPARARCGFGTYFTPGRYEDHWMTEYWQADPKLSDGGRWVQVDAQLDELQQKVLGISFDPLDLPAGQFVLAGEAWQMCRRGEADPDLFGIFEWKGMSFIKGNVLRDLLSLNNVEVLPWDVWGLNEVPVAEFTPAQMELLDRAAALTLAGNESFADLRELYEQNACFHAPEAWAQS